MLFHSTTDNWIFYGSVALSVIGLGISRAAPMLGMVLTFSFPVCFIFLLFKLLVSRDNKSRQQDAADASRIYDRAIHLLTQSADVEAIGPLSRSCGFRTLLLTFRWRCVGYYRNFNPKMLLFWIVNNAIVWFTS